MAESVVSARPTMGQCWKGPIITLASKLLKLSNESVEFKVFFLIYENSSASNKLLENDNDSQMDALYTRVSKIKQVILTLKKGYNGNP